MSKCSMVCILMNINQKLQLEDGAERANQKHFRILIGGLIYLTHTRLDISFSVGVVSRFMSNPSQIHCGAAKRILRYVACTLNYGIWYIHSINFKLIGFTENDWASSLDDRRNTYGNVFGLGSGAVTWNSKKQANVALSTIEAEYVAASAEACQCIWIRRMLRDLHQTQQKKIELYCDNKSAIESSKNPAFHGRAKHIELRFYFIRDLINKGELIMKFCHTEVQVADIFTKSLSNERYAYLRSLLRLSDYESRGVLEI
ncbi:hypothetical protein Scep_027633 [Stephania cephalantha]|uniref:Uncharacterized protein n=1 Tax=Stephania cephalantha TaxID=152367 RepID=A0AAP0E8E0_9MAGN